MWLSADPLSGYNPVMETEHYIDGQHNGGVYNSFNLNTYGYCYQNPVLYVDPNGKQSRFSDWWDGFKEGFKSGLQGAKEQLKNIVIVNFGTTQQVQTLAKKSFKEAESSSQSIVSGEFAENLKTLSSTDKGKGALAGVIVYAIVEPSPEASKVGKAPKMVKGIVNTAEDLIKASVKTVKQPRKVSEVNRTIIGNIDDIFETITEGAQKTTSKGGKIMPDGTTIFKHESTKGNGGTIDINKGGEINKIRVTPKE